MSLGYHDIALCLVVFNQLVDDKQSDLQQYKQSTGDHYVLLIKDADAVKDNIVADENTYNHGND